MKVAAVLLGLLIVGAATFLLVRPQGHGGATVAPSATPTESGQDSGQAPRPSQPLDAPLSREDEVRQQFAAKRIPFFRYLHDNWGGVVTHFAVTEEIDTLDLVVSKTDDETLRQVVENAVSPTAKEYGFRRIRFYKLNSPESVKAATLIAESTYDDAGHWNTFRK